VVLFPPKLAIAALAFACWILMMCVAPWIELKWVTKSVLVLHLRATSHLWGRIPIGCQHGYGHDLAALEANSQSRHLVWRRQWWLAVQLLHGITIDDGPVLALVRFQKKIAKWLVQSVGEIMKKLVDTHNSLL
jgi:hypothetical protein